MLGHHQLARFQHRRDGIPAAHAGHLEAALAGDQPHAGTAAADGSGTGADDNAVIDKCPAGAAGQGKVTIEGEPARRE